MEDAWCFVVFIFYNVEVLFLLDVFVSLAFTNNDG